MTKFFIAASAVALLGFTASAIAGDDWDLATACDGYKAENPESTLDCGCLVDKTGDNAGLLASYKAAAEGEELSEEAGAVAASCSAPPSDLEAEAVAKE